MNEIEVVNGFLILTNPCISTLGWAPDDAIRAVVTRRLELIWCQLTYLCISRLDTLPSTGRNILSSQSKDRTTSAPAILTWSTRGRIWRTPLPDTTSVKKRLATQVEHAAMKVCQRPSIPSNDPLLRHYTVRHWRESCWLPDVIKNPYWVIPVDKVACVAIYIYMTFVSFLGMYLSDVCVPEDLTIPLSVLSYLVEAKREIT